MAETDSDLMNLGYWVPLAAPEKSPRFEERDPWSAVPPLPPSYKPVYSPPSARTGQSAPLSLVQIPRDTVLSLVKPYYAGTKVYTLQGI